MTRRPASPTPQRPGASDPQEPAPDTIQVRRLYATEHQQALGPGWLSIPAYYHDYIGVLGPGHWWVGAVLWSRVPKTNEWTELPLREWATLSATSPSRLAAALRPGAPLSWLIERDPSRPISALDPETRTRLPARYRWRCGLPLTPGHQQDAVRWFAEHVRTYGRRPTLATLTRALEDLTHLPAQEVRGCLGPAARPAPSEPRPLTMREILQLASGLTLPVSVELAQLSQHLYAALAPQDLISVPEALPVDWLAELGHGALWLYVYAYTRSLLGDTPGVCHLDQGLGGVAALSQSGRTSVRRWLEHDARLGLLHGSETLSSTESIRLHVTAPTAIPLGPARAAGLRAQASALKSDASASPSRAQESVSDTNWVQSEHKVSPSGAQESIADTSPIHLGHKVSPFGAQAESISDTRRFPKESGHTGPFEPHESIWDTEEEEVKDSTESRSWMALPQLALRAGVSSPSAQQLHHAEARLPQEYVAFYLEYLAADLPAVNAWRNGILSPQRIAAGLREPYRGLAAAGPRAVALALRQVLTPDQPVITYALGVHVEDAQDLADELGVKIPDRGKRERACRLALRALSTADGRSLRDLADTAIAQAARVLARRLAEPEPTDTDPCADTAEEDPKDVLWSRALAQLRMELPHATFDMWLEETRLIEMRDEVFVVQAPTDFGAQWLTQRMSGAIRRVLGGLTAREPLEVLVVSAGRGA